MATNGYRPEADKLQETLNRTNLSQEAKREDLVTLKIDPSKLQKQLLTAPPIKVRGPLPFTSYSLVKMLHFALLLL